MKQKRKWIWLFACVVMVGCSFQSMAAEQGVGRPFMVSESGMASIQSVDLCSKTADIVWSGKDNRITAKSRIKVSRGCNITITMKLQKQNGKAWGPVETWTESYYGADCLLERSYSLTSSGTYRVHTVFTVDGTTYTVTSGEVRYLDGTTIQSVDFGE